MEPTAQSVENFATHLDTTRSGVIRSSMRGDLSASRCVLMDNAMVSTVFHSSSVPSAVVDSCVHKVRTSCGEDLEFLKDLTKNSEENKELQMYAPLVRILVMGLL